MNESKPSTMQNPREKELRIAILCVGNRLMLDDGIGPAVYDELVSGYRFPENVQLFDVGCMSLDMLTHVRDYDLLITVDALDGTGEAPGTVFRFLPQDMMRRAGALQSLHDLRLVDLFDTAALLDYEAQGICFGMQVENPSPRDLTIGLTPAVHAALPQLVETIIAELAQSGIEIQTK